MKNHRDLFVSSIKISKSDYGTCVIVEPFEKANVFYLKTRTDRKNDGCSTVITSVSLSKRKISLSRKKEKDRNDRQVSRRKVVPFERNGFFRG